MESFLSKITEQPPLYPLRWVPTSAPIVRAALHQIPPRSCSTSPKDDRFARGFLWCPARGFVLERT